MPVFNPKLLIIPLLLNCVLLLLGMPGNLSYNAWYCEFYFAGFWMFLYFYSLAFFWHMLKLLGYRLIILDFALIFHLPNYRQSSAEGYLSALVKQTFLSTLFNIHGRCFSSPAGWNRLLFGFARFLELLLLIFQVIIFLS